MKRIIEMLRIFKLAELHESIDVLKLVQSTGI